MTLLTVLDITQSILSEMNSDEVNQIGDTVEALQVANIVREVFNELVVERDLPTLKKRLKLIPSSDTDLPTHMQLASNVTSITKVYYDQRTVDAPSKVEYAEIAYCTPEDFLKRTHARDSTADNVLTVLDTTGTKLLIRTDRNPQFYTTFDDNTLVFDSYLFDVEATLQASKIMCYGEVQPQFRLEDTYTPEIPEKLHPLLLSEAKSRCFVSLKQFANEKVEQSARRLRSKSQRAQRVKHGSLPYPDFGRK